MSALSLDIGVSNPVGRSFGLVKKELDSTLTQLENHFSKFAEDQDPEASFQAFVSELNQVRGIFKLIEVPGAELLAGLMLNVSESVKNKQVKDHEKAILALGQAVFTLQRYMAFIRKEDRDVPILLLTTLNDLRRVLGLKPVAETEILPIELPKSLPKVAPIETNLTKAVGRLRHMYQIGLLSVLRKSSVRPSLKIMGRSLEGMEKATRGQPGWPLWWASSLMLQVMAKEQYALTPERKLLLAGLDRELRALVKDGVEQGKLNSNLFKAVLYLVAISSEGEAQTKKLKQWFGYQPTFNEAQLQEYRQILSGPDSSALASVANSILEEISKVKDSIDILSRSDLNVETHLQIVRQSLSVVADTLAVVQENEISNFCRQGLEDFNLYEDQSEGEQHKMLVQLANKLVQIEHKILDLKSDDDKTHNDLYQANKVVIDEIQNGIALAKRSISSFEESGFDKMHLANISTSLDSVRGGITFINEPTAQRVVENSLRFIKERLIPSELRPNLAHLESLADALTSVEYFFETMLETGEPSTEILEVAKDSMKQLGMPVA